MKESEEQAFEFWRRVDKVRGKRTLSDIADILGVKEQSVRVMRSRGAMPRALGVKAIAELLGVSQSYLLKGEKEEPVDFPEVDFVRNSPEARVLIRAVMNNPALLSALSLVIAGAGSKIDDSNIKIS